MTAGPLPVGPFGDILLIVSAAIEVVFVAIGGVAFLKWYGSANRLGVAPGAIVLARPLRFQRLLLEDLAAFETDYSLLVGASITLHRSGQAPVKVVGLEAMTVEGLASHLRASVPKLADPGGWGFTELPGGPGLMDPTWVQGFGGRRAPPAGRWATPTRAARQQIASMYAAIASMNLVILVWAPIMISNLDLAIALPFLAGSSLAALGCYLWLFLKARQGSPPHAGYSTFEVEGRTDARRGSVAVEAALRSTGLAVPVPTTRNLLVLRRTTWALPGVLRLRATVLEGSVRRLDLTTFGPQRTEAHRALKGFLLQALSASEVEAGRPSVSGVRAGRPPLESAPWDAAVMADGRLVPDGGAGLALESGATGPRGVWSSFPARAMQFMGIFLVPGLLVFVWVFGMMAVDGLRLGPQAVWGVWAIVVVLGAPTIVFTYPMIRGQYWYCMMHPPGAWNDLQAVDRLVAQATAAAGRRIASKRQGLLGVKWKLDAPLWFRYVTVGPAGSGMLQLYVNWRANLGLYARLKGCVIESLGTAPIPSPPPAAPTIAVPASAAAALLEDWGPLARATPGPRLASPPPWAFSAPPDGAAPVADLALGAGGLDNLPPGWWGSRDPAGDSRSFGRYMTLVAVVPGVAAIGLLMAISIAQTPSGSDPTASLVVVASMGVGAVLFAGLLVFSFRRLRKDAVRTQAHSFLRLEVPVERLGEVVARLDLVIRARIPEAHTVMPPVGAPARWEDLASSVVITLWRGVGSLPFIEFASNRNPAATAQLKGAMEGALFVREESVPTTLRARPA